MNMKLLGAGLLTLLIIAGAVYFVLNGRQTGTTPPSTTMSTIAPTNTDVLSSIKEALAKSMTLECSFTDEEGRQTKSYIKNGGVRADTTTEAEGTTAIIMKDNLMYMWNTSQKTGMKMELTAAQMQGEALPTTTKTAPQSQNIVESIEKYKNSCKPTTVSDSLFVPPTDVKFTDYSQLLKAPTGGATGSGSFNQQQIEDLIKQYAPSGTP